MSSLKIIKLVQTSNLNCKKSSREKELLNKKRRKGLKIWKIKSISSKRSKSSNKKPLKLKKKPKCIKWNKSTRKTWKNCWSIRTNWKKPLRKRMINSRKCKLLTIRSLKKRWKILRMRKSKKTESSSARLYKKSKSWPKKRRRNSKKMKKDN